MTIDPHTMNKIQSMISAVRSQDYDIVDIERAHSRIDMLAEVVSELITACSTPFSKAIND